MEAGVLAAVENQALTGDGLGENFTGLLNTSGTLSVAFSTDVLTTLRKARTALEMVPETPSAWLFNPTDAETFDLLREGGTTGAFLVGGASPAATNISGDMARVASPAVPAGTAIVGEWAQAQLVVREDVRLDADRSGDLFRTNAVQLRAEGRFNLAVLRPQSFAIVDLTVG